MDISKLKITIVNPNSDEQTVQQLLRIFVDGITENGTEQECSEVNVNSVYEENL
jgi:6,7-dimethyl-8-ribityllumazine synthase